MLRVGLTGGIACGKSTVAHMFAEHGAKIIDADAIAHELYRPGEEIYQKLVDHFGPEIVKMSGDIDRAKLANIVFEGGRVQELNKIVHPAVIKRQEQWLREITEKDPYAVAMVEAALIFEAGAKERFDRIIVVTCTFDQKVLRFARRADMPDALARAEVERRYKAQIPDEEKARRADFVIDNSRTLAETSHQVQRIYAELKVLSKRLFFG